MSRITSYFGLLDNKPEVNRLAATFLGIFTSITAAISISTTFYLIFIAEALGNGSYLNGMALAGVLIVVQKVVQILLGLVSTAGAFFLRKGFTFNNLQMED